MATLDNAAVRVLVVDDEPIVSDSISRVLALDHYEVETVASGQDALDALQRSRFDVVIVDYEMPGMKGDKLAAAIKAVDPQQRIIMITAYGEALRYAGNFPLPVDLVLPKPFGSQEFREAVRQLAAKA